MRHDCETSQVRLAACHNVQSKLQAILLRCMKASGPNLSLATVPGIYTVHLSQK